MALQLRDKLGRKINPQQARARRRNMLLGRFAFIDGAIKQLQREILSEFKECPDVVRHADVYLAASAASAQRELAIMRQITDEFFIDAHNLRTPQPKLPKESEK